MREAKRVNAIFSSIIIISITGELAISFWFYDRINLNNLIINEAIVESMLLVPAIAGILICRDREQRLTDRLGFHLIKPKALLGVILYGLVIIPVGTFANAISLLFTNNEVTDSSSLYLNQNMLTALMFVAIVGPLAEEFVFRGVIYNGYRKAGGRIGAVIMSALLFGLMHMNLNQLVYAFIIGILLALVAEAAGSVWAPMICHFMFNAENVIAMFLSEKLSDEELETAYEFSKDELLDSIIIYAFIAIIAVLIAILLLRWISDIQGTHEAMKEIFTGYDIEEKKNRIFTPILFVGILISVGYIILYEVLKKIM